MQTMTISIDRISSGSEMPSTPSWYRELMTLIQGSSTTNCSRPGSS